MVDTTFYTYYNVINEHMVNWFFALLNFIFFLLFTISKYIIARKSARLREDDIILQKKIFMIFNQVKEQIKYCFLLSKSVVSVDFLECFYPSEYTFRQIYPSQSNIFVFSTLPLATRNFTTQRLRHFHSLQLRTDITTRTFLTQY